MGRCYLLFAIALILLHVSWCTCLTQTPVVKAGTLSPWESREVYKELYSLAENIEAGRSYYEGHIFSKYLNIGGKGVAIRLTRWNDACSVKSTGPQTRGRVLKAAFQSLLGSMESHICRTGSEWAFVSNKTYWIDYFVRETYYGGEDGEYDSPAVAIAGIEGVKSASTDCSIRPFMLLSHHSATNLHKLNAGESVKSPNGRYELIVNPLSSSRASCYATLRDVETLQLLWSTDAEYPQKRCHLRFRSFGKLELWNNDEVVWSSTAACSDLTQCAGAASLVVDNGGVVKLYRTLDDGLEVYWYSERET